MRQVCSYCKGVYGFKCHKCGTKLSPAVPESALYMRCDDCNTIRPKSTGGDTHGICGICLPGVLSDWKVGRVCTTS